MALTAALKAQIGAWYKALQQQIPDFIPRAPQRQMIADVAKTLAGDLSLIHISEPTRH